MHIANYHDERAMLDRIIGEPAPERTIFLSGRSDCGKTWLLDWFEQQYGGVARVVRINLSDPDVEMNPALAMSMCVGKLGWDHFGDFSAALARRPANQAKIENIRSQGDNVTFIASAGVTLADQLTTALELTAAFVKGLAAAAEESSPIVICLDGYCCAPAPTRAWLEMGLVGDVARATCARLIITGREPAGQKLCNVAGALAAIELRGVDDVNEWARVANELGRALPGHDGAAALQVAISVTEGVPGQMMRWLQRLSPQAQA
ncbi:MAG: hypothetical protein QOH47_1595 [Sphingomonadales bacterium]|jgi:hypothetical protein|nr:hypothetical protein [Sphingomonadales bacterium]